MTTIYYLKSILAIKKYLLFAIKNVSDYFHIYLKKQLFLFIFYNISKDLNQERARVQ